MAELRRSKRKIAEVLDIETIQTTKPTKKALTAVSKQPRESSPRAVETRQKTDLISPTSSFGVGRKIDLSNFGGEVETNEGKLIRFSKLVEDCVKGVVIFTYPKASTPGCTTQVCLFRDSFSSISEAGFSVYGLSADSIKANTTFKTKQSLPYSLLCDPRQTLIKAIGMKKAPKGTIRGVFVVNKEGEILAKESGGPAATVEIAKRVCKEA